jgi:hypothetical protein
MGTGAARVGAQGYPKALLTRWAGRAFIGTSEYADAARQGADISTGQALRRPPRPHDYAMRIEGAQRKTVLVLPAAAGAAATATTSATTTAPASAAAAATTSATTTAAAGAAAVADERCPDAVLDHGLYSIAESDAAAIRFKPRAGTRR